MKVLLMGVGGQGGPCASIMARDKNIEKIILGDLNTEVANKVARKVNSEKIEVRRVDASDPSSVATVAEGNDVIIDLVTPKFYYNVMCGALKAKVNYVNTAYDKFMWDDCMEIGKKPKLYDEFAAVGKTAVLGCGMSSGYTNVVARHYIDKCDMVKSVKVRLAKKDLSIGKFGDAVTPWNPGWDPRQALLDFKLPQTVFREGKYELLKAPFSEIEEWDFPEPIGKIPVSHHAHEEPYSIPLSFADKGLTYCDFKYYVNMQVAPIISLGLASEEPLQVGGQSISPLDVVLAKVPKPADGFLDEDIAQFEFLDQNKFVALMLEIVGTKDGKEIKFLISIPTMEAPRSETYAAYGTSKIAVALPAVVGAKLIATGEEKKGVIFPHDLNPKNFLKIMEDTGFKHRFAKIK